MKKNIIIAIDGYASTGKSTIAQYLAQRLNFIYIDSGAMYRMVALAALQKNCFRKGVLDADKLEFILENMPISFKIQENQKQQKLLLYLNGVGVEEKIRGLEVSNVVSQVASNSKVRTQLVALQRKISQNKSVVMDGRDIGTVVFPKATIKIFITCDAQIRAERRYKELTQKGHKVTFEQVLKNITQRDLQDTIRTDSPLKKPEDAIEIDNSQMDLEYQFEHVYRIVKKNL